MGRPGMGPCQHAGNGVGGGGESGRQTLKALVATGPLSPLQPIARTRKRCRPSPTRKAFGERQRLSGRLSILQENPRTEAWSAAKKR